MPSSIPTTPNVSVQQPQETQIPRLKDNTKIVKIAALALSLTLALGTMIAGIVLSMVYLAPIFLTFIIATVLFAIVAYISYKTLISHPSVKFDWTKILNNTFSVLPDKDVYSQFITKYHYATMFQNRIQPKLTLCLPRYSEDAACLTTFPAIFRENKDLGLINQRGIIVNPVDPETRHVQTASNFLSNQIFRYILLRPGGDQEWLQSQCTSESRTSTLFSPGEIRAFPISAGDFAPPNLKAFHPSILMHALSPDIAHLTGTPQQIMDQYYESTKNMYRQILNQAMQLGSTLILLPIFSQEIELPVTQGINEATMDSICLSALLSAVNDIAKDDESKDKNLLIIVQPRMR